MPDDRNILHWMVSSYRAAHDLRPGDKAFVGFADRIRAWSRDFDAWQSEHRIGATVK